MSNDFYSTTKNKKARKEHQCKCCKSKILIGEPYEKQVGVYEGDFYSNKLCPICSQILDYLFYDKGYDELDIGDCLSEIEIDEKIYELLKQISHPTPFVEILISSYEEEKLYEALDEVTENAV